MAHAPTARATRRRSAAIAAALAAAASLPAWVPAQEVAPGGAAGPAPAVVSPADGAYFDVPRVTVAVDAPLAVDRVVVSHGKEATSLPARERPRRFFCGTATLDPGPNLLRVVGYEGERVAFQRAVWVYHEPDRIRGAKLPAGFVRAPFHLPGNEARCLPCHAFDYPPPGGGATPPLPPAAPGERIPPLRAQPCAQCHADVVQGKYVHGPAAMGLCDACHREDATPKFATPWPVSEICYQCHEHLREGMARDPYQHGPTAAGRCTLCHSPHASPHIFQTRKHIFDLCTTCHAEKANGRHVIYIFSDPTQTHPMRGRTEILRKDRELVCSSCHNPHHATSPKLWRYDAARRDLLCQYCHRK